MRRARESGAVDIAAEMRYDTNGVVGEVESFGDGRLRKGRPYAGRVDVQTMLRWHTYNCVRLEGKVVLGADAEATGNLARSICACEVTKDQQ